MRKILEFCGILNKTIMQITPPPIISQNLNKKRARMQNLTHYNFIVVKGVFLQESSQIQRKNLARISHSVFSMAL